MMEHWLFAIVFVVSFTFTVVTVIRWVDTRW